MADRRDLDNEPLPMAGNLGDLWSRLEERYQGYWDIIRRGQPMPEQTPLIPPPCRPRHFCPPPKFPGAPPSGRRYPPGRPPIEPPRPPSEPIDPGIPVKTGAPGMPMIDPRITDWFFSTLYDTLLTFKEDLKCGTYFVTKPAHIDPPQNAVRLDLKADLARAVTLPADGVFVSVLKRTTPDLAFDMVHFIANRVLGVADGELATVEWQERRNEAPLIDGTYNMKKADTWDSNWDREPYPIFVGPMSTFELLARNTGVAPVDVVARITGYTVAIKEISTDGTHSDYHVT